MKPKLPKVKKPYFNLNDEEEKVISSNKNLNFLLKNNFYKQIWKYAAPIYLQLISTTILTIVNSILLRWYENGEYSAVLNKATFAYSLISFLPTFASLGVFVYMGKFAGQNRLDETYKAAASGLVFNLSICFFITILLTFVKEVSFDWVNLDEKYRQLATTIYFFNIGMLWLNAMTDIFEKTEAGAGRVFLLFLHRLVANGLNVLISYLLIFHSPVGVIGSVIANTITSSLLLISLVSFNCYHFKIWYIFTRFKTAIQKDILITIVVIGLPAAVETLIFNLIGGFVTSKVTAQSIIYGQGDILLNTLLAANQIVGFGLFMSSAIGQVSSLFVSRTLGGELGEFAKAVTKRTWHLTLIFSILMASLMAILCWPLLKIYNIPTNVIWSYGIYLFLIAIFQEVGRTMNQVGLSALRTVKYTFVPMITGLLSLTLITFLPVFLISTFVTDLQPIQMLLIYAVFQAIEENVRGMSYLLLWNSPKVNRLILRHSLKSENQIKEKGNENVQQII